MAEQTKKRWMTTDDETWEVRSKNTPTIIAYCHRCCERQWNENHYYIDLKKLFVELKGDSNNLELHLEKLVRDSQDLCSRCQGILTFIPYIWVKVQNSNTFLFAVCCKFNLSTVSLQRNYHTHRQLNQTREVQKQFLCNNPVIPNHLHLLIYNILCIIHACTAFNYLLP